MFAPQNFEGFARQNLLPKARYVASQPKCDEDVTQGWEFLLINLWFIEWSRQIPKVVPFMAIPPMLQ